MKNEETALQQALRKSWMMTSRDVHAQMGRVLFPWDIKELKRRGHALDVGAEIASLKAQLGKN